MNRTLEVGPVELTLWFIGGVLCAYLIGVSYGAASVRAEAVRYGAAIESVDIETGKVRFEWK